MEDVVALDTLPEVLRPFEQSLNNATADTLRAHMERLRVTLKRVRLSADDQRWSACVDTIRRHPVWHFMQQDPFVRRAAEKPRGYPGDAVMIDYIYRASSIEREIASLPEPAAVIHEFINRAAAPRAVRYRRQFAAQMIDDVARDRNEPIRVVSIAAGHLREAELSFAARSGRASFVAIDQDPESLEMIRRSAGSISVETVQANVKHIIAGQVRIPEADLVYALGLFDYLLQPAAKRLCGLMLEAVRPGGVLLIPNFLPDFEDLAWMESFLDWKLVHRRDAEMLDLLGDWTLVSRAEIHRDPDQNITFLKVHRR
jgi:extracellular factor (EF) 3-hydroxypalmitic acid methyl ester biosynthesis protein